MQLGFFAARPPLSARIRLWNMICHMGSAAGRLRVFIPFYKPYAHTRMKTVGGGVHSDVLLFMAYQLLLSNGLLLFTFIVSFYTHAHAQTHTHTLLPSSLSLVSTKPCFSELDVTLNDLIRHESSRLLFKDLYQSPGEKKKESGLDYSVLQSRGAHLHP